MNLKNSPVRRGSVQTAAHDEVEQQGFFVVPGVIEAAEQRELLSTLGSIVGAGRRGLLALSTIAGFARSPRILDLIRPHLPSEPRPVRAIYFDKTPDTNWLVPWHQDLTIAVRAHAEVAGFGPWSTKDGIPHVQPPIEFLQRMLTLRLHLDDADESNGALQVVPGSHRFGRLSSEQIGELRSQQSAFLCVVSAGDALLMRPLLLHASRRSTSPGHRRVLHIEYAAGSLPNELDWNESA